jgi:hypothetical protein
VTFVPTDITVTNSSMFQTSLANLWNINNFNVWMAYRNLKGVSFWVGLSQYWGSCVGGALPGVYEPSFNWTWIDGSPLLRDTKGQGLAFFGNMEPNGYLNEHFGASDNDYLNDAQCSNGYRAICSIPRESFYFSFVLSHSFISSQFMC